MKLIDIYTLCRSGNHAIIFWILENLGGIKCVKGKRYFWNGETGVYYVNDASRGKIPDLKYPTYYLRSFEDYYPKQKDCAKKIIVLRDFINTICSRYKKYGPELGSYGYLNGIESIIETWKCLARDIWNDKAVGIIYNKWLTSLEYRDIIGANINIENRFDRIDFISSIGGGSSFIGENLETDKNRYLERYKEIALPLNMIKIILGDNELIELNIKIFSMDIRKQIKTMKTT